LYPTISHGLRTGHQVALTFDDGPDPQVTPRLLDALGAAGARATFFTIGRYLQQHPAIAERAINEAHELGNHSWQHDRMQNFYSTRAQAADIDRSIGLLQALSGSERPLYRPPIGLKSPALARAAHARRLTMIAWSLHSRDTRLCEARAIAAQVLDRIRPGDIVLLHDGHDREGYHRTALLGALPTILQGLRERGLQSVTVSELLGLVQTAAPQGR
jgi:peptidoglycan/xylan/chitin deacetylase (PgdA/CDA1 family)